MSNPYRDKLLSIGISVVATPTRNREAASRALWEYRNERDVPAYRRLRANGVQPETVHNAEKVEKTADTVEQVEGPKPDPELADVGF